MASSFQPNAFQSNAFQIDQLWPVAAFQSNAFSNNAFQAITPSRAPASRIIAVQAGNRTIYVTPADRTVRVGGQ